MAEVTAEQYQDDRKWEQHYFKVYRRAVESLNRGTNTSWANENVPRRSVKPGPWTRVRRNTQQFLNWSEIRRDIEMNLPNKPPNMSQTASRAWDRLQEAKLYFNSIPNVEYKTCLGRGGQGIIILCVYTKPDTGVKRHFVVKLPFTGDAQVWNSEALRIEGSVMERLDRAEHIVQLIPREEVGLPPAPPDRPRVISLNPHDSEEGERESSGSASPDSDVPHILPPPRSALSQEEQRRRRDQWEKGDTRNQNEWSAFMTREAKKGFRGYRDYLVLEYLKNGPLMNLILFNRASNRHTPNRVLWSFWLCLVRACIGLEFWPKKFHPDRHRPVAPGTSRDLTEELPQPNRRWRRRRLVHYDIDPLNILIGDLDLDDPDHSSISDFGLSQRVYPEKRDVYYHSMRHYAKESFFTPEQFTNRWDKFGVDPDSDEISRYLNTGTAVGANYDVASNIWGIASSMYYLITGHLPPRPPHPKRHTLRAGRLKMRTTLWTYGDSLFDRAYYFVDRDLIDILVRCLAYNPRHRPGLDELLDVAKRGQQKMFAGETDQAIKDYFTAAGINAPTPQAAANAGYVPNPPADPSFTWSQHAVPMNHSIRNEYQQTFRNGYNIIAVDYNDDDHGYMALRDSLLAQLDNNVTQNVPSLDEFKNLGASAIAKYNQFTATQPGRVLVERLGAVTYDWAISHGYNMQLGLRFTDRSLRVIPTPNTNKDTVTVWIRVAVQQRETKNGVYVIFDGYNCMVPKPDPNP
ncbi:kinase-like domain-containing protein [Biscogniauxia mediterranea]|nr:kinase-like domain-containing protein [Biscogniauxia mediterranea]